MERQVTIEQVITDAGETLKASLYKVMPGIVQAYYPPVEGVSPTTIDVLPAVNDVRTDLVTGGRLSEPWQPIQKVPVSFPQGGGFSIVFPLKKGDKVTLFSYDLDPTAHVTSGSVEDPIATRRHGGNHWVAFPGDITNPGAGPDPGANLVIGMPNGTTITIGETSITIGGTPTATVTIGATATEINMGPVPEFLAQSIPTLACINAIFAALTAAATNAATLIPPGSGGTPANPMETSFNTFAAALVAAVLTTAAPLVAAAIPILPTTVVKGT